MCRDPMCACVWEREREKAEFEIRKWKRASVHVRGRVNRERQRESVCVCDSVFESVCVRKRKSQIMCGTLNFPHPPHDKVAFYWQLCWEAKRWRSLVPSQWTHPPMPIRSHEIVISLRKFIVRKYQKVCFVLGRIIMN